MSIHNPHYLATYIKRFPINFLHWKQFVKCQFSWLKAKSFFDTHRNSQIYDEYLTQLAKVFSPATRIWSSRQYQRYPTTCNNLQLKYRLWGKNWIEIVLMNAFSLEWQNLCGLSLAFIICWRVVFPFNYVTFCHIFFLLFPGLIT